MLRKVRQYISDNQLFGDGDKVLLAVSGGPDSVAMADIMHRMHVRFGICHVNFQLRGADSDADEAFVRAMADRYRAPIYVLRADTKAYAHSHGISIEMAAREIRYSEFDRIMDQYGYRCTAVAHHQDDAIETFMLNLVRGAGIRGLTGIRVSNGRIVRPLLCMQRSDIELYLTDRGLDYRTDKTNLETDFARNKIRNLVLPVLEQINPSARKSISESLRYLGMAKELYASQIEQAKRETIPEALGTKKETKILIEKLRAFPEPECLLYEIASQYGFHKDQCASILRALDGESGKIFSSHSHRIIKDRDCLIISELQKPGNAGGVVLDIVANDSNIAQTCRHTLAITRIRREDFAPQRDPNVIYLDLRKLSKMGSRMEVSGWRDGDSMTTFGGKRKKLSDIFIDNKLSINDKENAEILRCGNQILWIIGIRTSNHCRIDDDTTEILKITAKKK